MARNVAYEFQGFRLSLAEHRLTRGDDVVHIEPQAFAILRYFIEHRDRVVSKDELLDQFWANKVVTVASISNEIRQIRKALNDTGQRQSCIRTVHGVGYQFAAEVHLVQHTDASVQPSGLLSGSLLGRTDELSAVSKRLLTEPNSIITLLGPGGIGKTTLSKAIADLVTPHFAQGVWFIELLAANTVTQVLDEIVTTLGLSAAVPGPYHSDSQYADAIRAALEGKHCLLVLDNFEHVISAAQAISIVAQAGGVSVLVTSRQRLSVKQEAAVVLEGLSLEQSADGLSDAAQLFVKRASLYLNRTVFTVPEQKSIEHICLRVGGTPLAIEMAAAWLRYMSLEELEAEVSNNLKWLETDLVDVPERQRSTQQIFDFSWQNLTPNEQEGLSRLAIWPLGFTRKISQVWGGLNLTEIVHMERAGLITLHDNGLYTIHELIRQMTLDKSRSLGQHDLYFRDFVAWLEYQGRYLLHLGQTDISFLQERIPLIRILFRSFDRYLDWFVDEKRFDLIRTFFILGFNAYEVSRQRTRQVERYLPILKPHEPYEFYISVSMEKLFTLVWQNHDNLDHALAQAFALFDELADEPKVLQARIAAIISQIYHINGRLSDSEVWAKKAIGFFDLNDLDPREADRVQTTDSICQSWAYSNLGEYKTALAYTDKAILAKQEAHPKSFWYGGFATKAWNLAHLGDATGSYQHSALLFAEAIKRNQSEFFTIWTIQAAQTAELLGNEDIAARFLAYSEFFLNAFKTEDLVQSRRTHEVIDFLARMENTLGSDAYQTLLQRWQGRDLQEVIDHTLADFNSITEGLPTNVEAYFAKG